MPSLVVPNTVEVKWIWQFNTVDYAINVLHYILPTIFAVNQAAANAYAADVGGNFTSMGWAGDVADDVKFQRITLRDLRTANQPEISANVNVSGTSSTDPLPLATSACITLRTALAGRSFRGRVYLPGAAESANASTGTIGVTAGAHAAAFVTEMIEVGITSGAWTLGVCSRKLQTILAVNSATLRDNVWDVQRRRNVPGI